MNCKDISPLMGEARAMRYQLRKVIIPRLNEGPNKERLEEALAHLEQALRLFAEVHVTLD